MPRPLKYSITTPLTCPTPHTYTITQLSFILYLLFISFIQSIQYLHCIVFIKNVNKLSPRPSHTCPSPHIHTLAPPPNHVPSHASPSPACREDQEKYNIWVATPPHTHVPPPHTLAPPPNHTPTRREDQEKYNIWVAKLNMEHMYGTDETLQSTLNAALQQCDQLTVYRQMISIYVGAKRIQVSYGGLGANRGSTYLSLN